MSYFTPCFSNICTKLGQFPIKTNGSKSNHSRTKIAVWHAVQQSSAANFKFYINDHVFNSGIDQNPLNHFLQISKLGFS